MIYCHNSRKGIALVVTLSVLVIATILVIGFLSSMRTERQASLSVANSFAANEIARTAINHAIAILDKNIPSPVPPGGSTANPTNWVISPGRLTTIQGAATRIQIPLSSNPSSTYAATAQDAQLNVPEISGSGYTILPTADPMRVAWVPILKDPTAAASASNQIAGRYAFWIDDENSKININTAYGKPSNQASYYSTANSNSYTYGMPSFVIPLSATLAAPTADNPYSLGGPHSVSLDVLSGLNRDSLWTDHLQRQFVAPDEVGRYATGGAAGNTFYDRNKFWLTTHSRDPEFNVFGKSRIFLTDSTFQSGDAAGAGFNNSSVGFAFATEQSTTGPLRDSAELLTFHADGNTGASTSVTASTNPTIAAVNELAAYLNTVWPGYHHTFVEKWSTTPGTADAVGQREAQQVAWNIYGMAASAAKETTNGVWCNQTPASAQPAPTPSRFAAMLWDGPKPVAAWPSSRILPQTRSPYVNKMAISFIATQFTRNNSGTYITDPATGQSIKGTTKYVVNVRFNPQIYFPLGYQGTQTFDSSGNSRPWNAANDEIYVTHFEATIDDGTSPTVVKWASEAPNYDGSLYWDANGGTYLYKFNGSGVLSPDTKNYNFATAQVPWDFSSKDSTVKPSSTPPPGYTPRSIAYIFDAGAESRPCKISNVKIRFIVTTGTGANIAPYQISPIRDIDRASGFDVPTAQDSGAIVFPAFEIPTDTISSSTPEYWMSADTLDPRVNQHGTPAAGATANDDWQVTSSTPSFVAPSAATRNSRLSATFPTVGTAGDESKLAWLDASPYIVSSGTKTRWGMHPGHVHSRLPTIGLLSCISTGIQSAMPWRTLHFQPTTDDPPDWLLLDLFAVPFNRTAFASGATYPDAATQPLTYLNSTAGKININATIFPTSFALPATTRSLPLQALLHGSYRPQVAGATVTQPDETALFNNIQRYLQSKTSPNTESAFDYAGEICQVPGFADMGNYDWEKEALVRELGSLITTRSNSFSVYGVAQTVKKNPANTTAATQGTFETRLSGASADDIITGEKRFRAVVERYVWPGADGMAGNAQTDTAGVYNQLGATAYVGSSTNSTDGLDPTQAAFASAYNPGAALMKYRVVYFEYLN